MGKNEFSRRVDKIQTQLCPRHFADVEDILRVVHLKRRKDLTDQERRTLEESENLPPHPDLAKTLEDIQRTRNERAQANRIS